MCQEGDTFWKFVSRTFPDLALRVPFIIKLIKRTALP